MSQRSFWIVIAALSLTGVARADAPANVGVKPAAGKPATKPSTASKPRPKSAAQPTTKPSTTRPDKELSADEMMEQMLKAPERTGRKPLPPLPEQSTGGADKSSGAGAVAPTAPVVNTLREGTYIMDRIGRLSRSADGKRAEFLFETDGTALQDPPLLIIPNIKLMQMEDAATNQGRREVRFRISGTLTEYRGRNYILMDKVVVVPDILEKF